MKYYIVAFATFIAMFWDEMIISLVSVVINKRIEPVFMVSWIIISGILASILISYHVPEEYRIITLLLVGFGVLFSLNGYILKEKHEKDSLKI